MKRFKLKRLKIVEQIIIVLLGAVIVPMVVSGIIINNINQHSIRSQLNDSATFIAKIVSEEIDVVLSTFENELDQIKLAASYLNDSDKDDYLEIVSAQMPEFTKLEIVSSNPSEEIKREREGATPYITKIFTKMNDGKYLIATINIEFIKDNIFKAMHEEERQIYVLSKTGKVVASHNFNDEGLNEVLKALPKKLKENAPYLIGKIKNKPMVYYKKTNPEIIIVVNTPANITKRTINTDRFKIILSVFIASMTIILVVGFYTYYLYINIRQLFKGIIAISKGNYQRRIRLLKSAFTPYEIVFLAFEFNRMAAQIHRSYIELQEKNKELKRLDKFRSNLIDTVSHEFRTPLTSIQGYTSRLLRQDIHIDEEMKQKSLRTIKRQSERLSRMVEDLLIVPDIDGSRINVNLEPVSINNLIDAASVFANDENFINKIPEDFPLILADKDRLEQVFVNLVENAKKYAYEGTELVIEGKASGKYAHLYFKNKCDKIPEDKINLLFEKFIRIDNETTRTTRGTGLGLFIVKGLVEAMNGKIKLHSTDEYGFIAELRFKIVE